MSEQPPSDDRQDAQTTGPQTDDPQTADPQTADPQTDATKPTEQWTTGGEPATGPQRSYLQTLAREAGEEVPEQLTKAEASETIDRLQQRSGRTG